MTPLKLTSCLKMSSTSAPSTPLPVPSEDVLSAKVSSSMRSAGRRLTLIPVYLHPLFTSRIVIPVFALALAPHRCPRLLPSSPSLAPSRRRTSASRTRSSRHPSALARELLPRQSSSVVRPAFSPLLGCATVFRTLAARTDALPASSLTLRPLYRTSSSYQNNKREVSTPLRSLTTPLASKQGDHGRS